MKEMFSPRAVRLAPRRRSGHQTEQGLRVAVLDGFDLFGGKTRLADVIHASLIDVADFVGVVASQHDAVCAERVAGAAQRRHIPMRYRVIPKALGGEDR